MILVFFISEESPVVPKSDVEAVEGDRIVIECRNGLEGDISLYWLKDGFVQTIIWKTQKFTFFSSCFQTRATELFSSLSEIQLKKD